MKNLPNKGIPKQQRSLFIATCAGTLNKTSRRQNLCWIVTLIYMEKKNENEIFDVPININNKDELEKLVGKFTALYSLQEQVKILNMKQVTQIEDIGIDALRMYVADREKK